MSTYIWNSFTPSGPLYSATHLPEPTGVSRMSVLPDWSSRIQNFSATPLPWPLSRRLQPDRVRLP